MRTEEHASARSRGEWSARALEWLAAEGYRAGGARRAVIELLADEGGCVEADWVVQRLRERDNAVGTASVYRALNLLSDLGLLHKVAMPDAPVRFELVLPGGEHHHHIVCDECGRTVTFTDEPLEAAIHSLSARISFDVLAHDITLHGTCEACRS